jgi:hypothetical protein
MEPRWKPSYTVGSKDKFLGYANDLDVWLESGGLVVVGPTERKVNEDNDMNYDSFNVVGNRLVMQGCPVDLHIDVHDMCLIYALCTEHGIFKENENA